MMYEKFEIVSCFHHQRTWVVLHYMIKWAVFHLFLHDTCSSPILPLGRDRHSGCRDLQLVVKRDVIAADHVGIDMMAGAVDLSAWYWGLPGPP